MRPMSFNLKFLDRVLRDAPYGHFSGRGCFFRALRQLRGLLLGYRLVDHTHDVGFLHDQVFDTIDLDLGARPFAEQDAVANPDIDRDEFAGFVAAARSDGDDLALRGLFLGSVGNDYAAGRFFLGIDALDDYAIVKRAKFHASFL